MGLVEMKTYLLTIDKNDAISISLKRRMSNIDEIIDIFDADWFNTISNGKCYIDWRLLENPTEEFRVIYECGGLSDYDIILINEHDAIDVKTKNDF